jgi:MoxR-like ATPase
VPDDVREVLLPALRHRIALSPELQLEGQSPDAVLAALRERVKAPQK